MSHGIWKIHDVTTIQTIYSFQPQLQLLHPYHWFTGPPAWFWHNPQGISPEWPGLLRSWSTTTPSVESSSWTTSAPGGDAARILSLDSRCLCSRSDMRDNKKKALVTVWYCTGRGRLINVNNLLRREFSVTSLRSWNKINGRVTSKDVMALTSTGWCNSKEINDVVFLVPQPRVCSDYCINYICVRMLLKICWTHSFHHGQHCWLCFCSDEVSDCWRTEW